MSSGESGRLIRQIPTQYPFVLVNRILEHDPGGRLVAAKNVSGTEDFFAGHFPGQPVMPGVLIIEAMAQAGAVLLLHDMADRDSRLILFTGIDKARFRRPVVPGDQLRYEVELTRKRRNICRMMGRAYVGDELTAEAELTAMAVDVEGEKAE